MTDDELVEIGYRAVGKVRCEEPCHMPELCYCRVIARSVLAAVRPVIEAMERERCAKLADDFSWILSLCESRAINEATDDAACMVQQQIATAIRDQQAHDEPQEKPE